MPLELITVYYNTTDYPNVYVGRLFTVDDKGSRPTDKIFGPTDTLEKLRSLIPDHLVRIDRDINDDKNIVEVWI